MSLSVTALKTLSDWIVNERPAEEAPAPPMVFAYFWFPSFVPAARDRYGDVARWWCTAVGWPPLQHVFSDSQRGPRTGLLGLLDLAPVYPEAAVVTMSPESLADKPAAAARLADRLGERFARLSVITTAYIASVPGGAELLAADAGEKP